MQRGIFFGKDNPNYKTGLCCNGKRPRIYNEWQNMKARCFNLNHKNWHRYGGRGITVCKEWMEFKNFKEWAFANGYRDDLSLDRIDLNGNYEPNNCQWITLRENSQKSSRIKLNYKKAENIRKRCLEDRKILAEEFNVSVKTIDAVLNYREWN